ncbi:unnamed protein product, partial [Rangifer tarandus platyrhynchus]
MVFAELLEQAGGAGLFQALQILTFFLFSVWVPFQLVMESFSAAIPGHCCWVHLPDSGSEAPTNLSPEALLPWQLLDPKATAASWSEPCADGWVHNRSASTSTIVTEWDLVCDHQGLKPLGQSIYMAGAMVGCIVCGFLSHRFGRKPVLSWCCLLVAAASISTVVAPSFPDYCGLWFLSALGWPSPACPHCLPMVEWTTTSARAVTMAILRSTYNIGQMAMGGLAFALREWRTLQLAGSVPFFVIFLISWSVWCKPDQMLQELKKVAKINGHKEAQKTLTIEVLMPSMQEEVASAKSRQSVLDLFCLPGLRWRSCNLLVVKSSSSPVSYYGIVLDLQNLGRDIFLLQVLLRSCGPPGPGHHHLPAQVLQPPHDLGQLPGRGRPHHLANMLVRQDLQTLRVVFAVLGKACFGLSLTCIMIYKPALFPTSLHLTHEGFLHSAARLGSVMGPLIRMTRQVLALLPPLSYGASPSQPASSSFSSWRPGAFHSLTPSRTWRDRGQQQPGVAGRRWSLRKAPGS